MRRYDKSDFEVISKWFDVPHNMLPTVGFIEPGVAVGFLVQTDTNMCFLEPFIANPQVDRAERNLALYAIMQALLDEAKALKYDMALGIATHKGMIQRAYDLGFTKIVGNNELVGRRL